MELEITWERTLRIWWAFFWRSMIAMVVAMGCGYVMGFIVGFVLALLGASKELIVLVVTPLGFMIGACISVFPLKMILGKNFGEFRLVLKSNSEVNS